MANLENLTINEHSGDVPVTHLMVVGKEKDNVFIEPKTKLNVQVPLDIPEGYTFGAYLMVAFQDASDQGYGGHECFVRLFGTTGGGTIANVSVYNNMEDTQARVKVQVKALLFKNA